VEKLQQYLRHIILMVSATLLVAAISITALYFVLAKLIDSSLIERVNLDIINTPLIYITGITIIITLLVMITASIIYFHFTMPLTQKIEQQTEIFHTLVKTAHEAIFLIDTKGNIQFTNPAAESLFGYTKKDLLGKSINLLMPSTQRKKHGDYIKNYLKTGVKKVIGTGRQILGQRKDGSQFPMYISVGEIQLKHSHLFAGLIMDLSTQQKLQRELLAVPAREQQRIGEELHDGLGQQLTGLSMLAQSLLNKASKPEHELASQLASGLNEALTQVRALSRGLIPVQIYTDGLIIALQAITENIEQQSHIPIKLQIDNTVLPFDDATATHLYRIVQESLNNAVKHASASQIEVSLVIEQSHGVLKIIDNGIGIPQNLVDSSGLGLNIMKHRCGLFNGEITINPDGNHGTKVCCRFPVNNEVSS